MEEVKVAWPTARKEARPPWGFSPIVVMCGRFDFPPSGQLGLRSMRVFLHGYYIPYLINFGSVAFLPN